MASRRKKRIRFFKRHPNHGLDVNPREHPCPKTTWCVLLANHTGGCVEVPRKP